ncbi:MAG: DUF6065 family protein, partial [Caulobacteraceae bacterium]
MWISGPPNHVKDGIQPLTAMGRDRLAALPLHHELDLHPAGQGALRQGRAVLLHPLMQDKQLEQFDVVQRSLEGNPPLKGQYDAWAKQRRRLQQAPCSLATRRR